MDAPILFPRRVRRQREVDGLCLADAHGYLLSPHSRLSRKLAQAAFLQMSNGLALEFGMPVFAAAAFAAQLPYVTFPDGSPGLWPGAHSK